MPRRAKPAVPAAGGALPPPPDTALAGDIDALYQQPLASFTGARNGLAQSLTRAGSREAAAGVKALAKPGVVPWAVNQVYWQARSIWDRLRHAGTALRTAQIAALEKPGATPRETQRARDVVRDATAAHRQAVADAVHQAVRLAARADAHPNPDHLSRMLEALSLAASLPAAPGRFTEVLQPAGFEALFGVTPAPPTSGSRAPTRPPAGVTTLRPKGEHRDDRTRAEADAQAAHTARVAAATEALTGARTAARAAADEEARAVQALADAELRVTQAQAHLRDARSAVKAAGEARDKAERALARLTSDA